MPHIRFNWVDILFVTLLIRTCYVGLKNGFLPEFFRCLGLLVAFVISFNSYASLSHFISIHTRWSGASPDIISFLFIFLAILFIFKIPTIAAGFFFRWENLAIPNRLIGLLLGLGRGSLLISLIYIMFANGPFQYLAKSAEEKSFLGPYVSDFAPFVYRNGIKIYPWNKNDTALVRMLESEV